MPRKKELKKPKKEKKLLPSDIVEEPYFDEEGNEMVRRTHLHKTGKVLKVEDVIS